MQPTTAHHGTHSGTIEIPLKETDEVRETDLRHFIRLI